MHSLKVRLVLLLVVLFPLFSSAQNNALNFDASGTPDYVSCGDIDLYSFTFQANIKVSDIGMHTILSKGDGNGGGENYIFQVSNGLLALQISQPTTSWTYSNAMNTVPNNIWCHVAVTYDNTSRTSTFYINGVPSGSSVRPSVDPFQDNNPTYIGRQGTNCNCNYFTGEMDEVSIWNRALTCDEINSWKNCNLNGTESGLLDYYKFDQGVAAGTNTGLTNLPDSGPGNKPGTLIGFALNGTVSNWVTTGAAVSGNCGLSTFREINLAGNSNPIAGDGSNVPSGLNHTDFAKILPFTSVTRTYTIQNPGTAGLTVNDISIFGVDAGLFSRSPVTFPLTIVAGGSETFDVTFTPTDPGMKYGEVHIYSDDCNEGIFYFPIQGEGGYPGEALNFTGSSCNVRIPYDPSLNLSSGNFTVEFWARPTLVDSDHHWVVTKDEGNSDLDYGVAVASNNKWLFAARNVGLLLSGTSTVVAGNYYHVACVLLNGKATLYVNGVQEATTTIVGSPAATNTSDVLIGARTSSSPQQYFKGDIDEVRLWNRGLCLDEIANNKNCEIPTSYSGLVANYHFNNGVAAGTNYGLNLLYDASGGGHNGSLYGMTYVGASGNWVTPGGVTQGTVCVPFSTPEISVKGNSIEIPSDGSNTPVPTNLTDFGSVTSGSSVDKTFIIFNDGTANLNLTTNITNVKVTGSSDFTLTVDAAATISPGTSSFTIKFSPTTTGVQSAVVTILSNDCDEGTYKFNVSGNGTSALPATTLNFDGVNDYVETPFVPSAAVMKNFTIECWVKGNLAPASGGNVYNGPVYGSKLGIIWDHQNGSFAGSASVTAADGNYGTASFGTLLGNTWYHLAATYDGVTGTLKSYTNGVLQNTAVTNGGIADDPSTLKLGTHPNLALGFPHNFPGSIDEVRVWSKVLSATEIANSRTCELSGPQECLELYYKFNQGNADGNNASQTTLTDQSGKSRNGTLNNFSLSGAVSNFSSGVNVSGVCSPVFFPEINVTGNGLSIAAEDFSPFGDDSTDFGSFDITSGSNINTFTITNYTAGAGNLILSGTPAIQLTGSPDFTLEADAGSGAISSNMSTTFRIKFDPSTVGTQVATVTIMSNDCDEGVYRFQITGKGTSVAAGSLDFDGVNDIISINNSQDFRFETNDIFSLEFWFKTTNTAQQAIISSVTNAFPYNGYEVSTQSGYLAFFMSSNFSSSNYLNMVSSTFIADGNWHHGAIVYNGISDVSQIQMYVDEQLQVCTGINTLTSNMASSNVVHIGGRGNSGQSLFYKGLLDDIRIFNRALCSAEINSYNNCDINPTTSGLLGYYKFNDGALAGNNNSLWNGLSDQAGSGDNNGVLSAGFALSGLSSNWVKDFAVLDGSSCGPIIAPEITLTGKTLDIQSGTNPPTTDNNTDFGNVQSGNSRTLSFTLKNSGSIALNFLTTPTIEFFGSTDFSVVNALPATLAAGATFNLSIKFTPTSPGTHTASVYIINNDCDEGDFHFSIMGLGLPPAEIDLSQNGASIASGGNYDFGNRIVNIAPLTKIFTVSNTAGGSKLALNGIPRAQLSGPNVNQFILVSNTLPDTINGNSFANFTIQFLPTTAGDKTAQLRIANNDPDESNYTITLYGRGVVAGDVDSSGSIAAGEIAGDTSGNGTIEYPDEITGDLNGNGSIGAGEVSGDADGDGIINNGEIAGNTDGVGGINGNELCGDANGNGGIEGREFLGDKNGNGILDPGEEIGDTNGDGTIDPNAVPPEVAGDIDGNGTADPEPGYVLVGKGTVLVNYISTYTIQPQLPPYYTYAWDYTDESMLMIKDTTRFFMDVVANNQTNNGTLICYVYRFGQPYDTLEFNIVVNKSYLNIAELAELSSECAAVANPANNCQESFIDYFKLNTINYDGNGCVRGGYQDLTTSGHTTDLEMGFTYTVELKPNKLLFFPNPLDPSRNDTTNVFYAVWIDYNNDGDFEDFAEYVKNGDSKSAAAKLINITIANNNLYQGSRRLRVGMKTGSGFTATDACGINAIGSSGELEDYLITLVPMGALQAPNFLSPNNDGNNDLFSIKGVNTEKSRILTVINKAGSVVYQEENYGDKELWSGRDSKGELLPKGTYYYIFKNGSEELRSFLELDY